MSFDSRTWSRNFDLMKRKIKGKRQSGVAFNDSEVKQLQQAISTLDAQLKLMHGSPMEYEMAASELARRQILLSNLKSQMAKSSLSVQMAAGGAANPRDSSISTLTMSTIASRKSETSNPMTEAGMGQRAQAVIKQQDQMLDGLALGVERLHDKAHNIGQETRLQNKLLDDLEGNVDVAHAGLAVSQSS
jgi:DNA repair exonuclease SbcCD ATPase subunit